jgi:hypothetical protein
MWVLILPQFDVIAAACVAILVLLAAGYLVRMIAAVIPRNLPVIGSRIYDWIVSLGNFAFESVRGLMDAAVAPIHKILAYPVMAISRLFDVAIAAVGELTSAVRYIRTAVILYWYHRALLGASRLVNAAKAALYASIALSRRIAAAGIEAARHYASALVSTLQHQLGLAIHRLEAGLTAAINLTRALATAGILGARHYAAGLVAVATAALSVAIRNVDAFAHAAYRDTLGRLVQLTIYLEHYAINAAKAAVNESTAVLDLSIYTGLVDVWQAVDAETAALAGGIAIDFPDILAGIRAIPRAIPRDAATAIEATAALSIPMLRYLRQCGLGNCRNLGELGKALRDLELLIDSAGMLEFIAEFVHDPQGAAQAVDDEFHSLTDDLSSGLLHLVGLA